MFKKKLAALMGLSVIASAWWATPAHSGELTFSGQLDLIAEDVGGAIYSGVPLGTDFSGTIDDQTFSGTISNGTTTTTFGCCIAAGGLEVTNNELLDAETASLLSTVTGSTFNPGDPVDLIQIEGDTATLSGGRLEAGVTIVMVPSAFDDESLSNYPPDTANVLVTVFFILEEDASDDIYSAVGVVDNLEIVAAGASVLSSVLPSSRSVEVGVPATFFATVINSGTSDASQCTIAPSTTVDADFSFQETDPLTNATVGVPDAPVDIAAGAFQTFLFAYTPRSAFDPVELELAFDCANTDPAPRTTGLNTVLLSSSSTPTPDVVALAATPTGDGVVVAQPNGVFSVASVNVGAGGDISVSADLGGLSLPLGISLCETDPTSGACINPTTPAAAPVETTIEAGETPTFGIFVSSTGTIDFSPGVNRIFVRFDDAGGVTRGSTSVAVRSP